jgi:hypothetical protein
MWRMAEGEGASLRASQGERCINLYAPIAANRKSIM